MTIPELKDILAIEAEARRLERERCVKILREIGGDPLRDRPDDLVDAAIALAINRIERGTQ